MHRSSKRSVRSCPPHSFSCASVPLSLPLSSSLSCCISSTLRPQLRVSPFVLPVDFGQFQRLLMGRLGSAQLDSTIACSIMFLCDVGDCKNNGNDSMDADRAGLAQAGDRKGPRRKKHPQGARGTKGKKKADGTAWSQKQMTSLVWAVGHSNQDVLTYTAWTL